MEILCFLLVWLQSSISCWRRTQRAEAGCRGGTGKEPTEIVAMCVFLPGRCSASGGWINTSLEWCRFSGEMQTQHRETLTCGRLTSPDVSYSCLTRCFVRARVCVSASAVLSHFVKRPEDCVSLCLVQRIFMYIQQLITWDMHPNIPAICKTSRALLKKTDIACNHAVPTLLLIENAIYISANKH